MRRKIMVRGYASLKFGVARFNVGDSSKNNGVQMCALKFFTVQCRVGDAWKNNGAWVCTLKFWHCME